MDHQPAGGAVVIDKAQLPELVHEMTHARAGGAHHLRQVFLIDSRKDCFGTAFLAKMSQQQKPGLGASRTTRYHLAGRTRSRAVSGCEWAADSFSLKYLPSPIRIFPDLWPSSGEEASISSSASGTDLKIAQCHSKVINSYCGKVESSCWKPANWSDETTGALNECKRSGSVEGAARGLGRGI